MRACVALLALVAFAFAQECYKTTDAVNIRQEPSPNANKLGMAPSGTTVTRVGTERPNTNGYVWIKINYNGVVGYSVVNWLAITACAGGNTGNNGNNGGSTGGSCSFSLSGSPDFRAANTAPITKDAIVQAARTLGVEPAAVKAVCDVEAGANGFLGDGRPKILYEAQQFYRLTNGAYGSCTSMSCSYWNRNLYQGGAAEYNRLMEAYGRDKSAAVQAASWGAFQIMGFNYRTCGYSSIESFIADMKCGHDGHMRAFIGFIKANGLQNNLAKLDWAGFAYRYNGAGYAANAYDRKMAEAYQRAKAAGYNNVDEADVSLAKTLEPATRVANIPVALMVVAAVAAVLSVAVVIVAVKLRRARQSTVESEASVELL